MTRNLHRTVAGLGPALALSLLASTAPAQNHSAAGFGALLHTEDLESAIGENTLLGVAFVGGSYYVSSRGAGPTSTHLIHRLDKSMTLVGSYPQPAAHQSPVSAWGVRDMATDGQSLMGGSEAGLSVWDPTTGSAVNTVQAQNGPQGITQPITGPGLAAVDAYRAVAFDPAGNGGNGSVWIGDFARDIIEIDLQGNVLATLGSGSLNNPWAIYGFALDTATGNLWANAAPANGDISEIDTLTGSLTGRTFAQAVPGGLQGGLSRVDDPDPLSGLPYKPVNSFVSVSQNTLTTPDTLGLHRGDLYAGLAGVTESALHISAGTDPLAPANTGYDVGVQLNWQATPNGSNANAGMLALFLLNLGADAVIDGSTPGSVVNQPGTFPEALAIHPLSNPPLSAPGNLVSFLGTVGNTMSVTLPPAFPVGKGDVMRMQAVVAEPASTFAGLMATNQLCFIGDPQPAVEVRADGSNSFNSSTNDGYWKVIHNRGADIVEVEIDMSVVTNGPYFDTDQTSMSDRFDGGNFTTSPCRGTYRLSSHTNTGLIFDSQNTLSACTGSANTGWIASIPVSTNSYRKLQFRFTAGQFSNETFEFDADTDGGSGISGDAMAGVGITVKLSDGTVYNGPLVVDPNTSSASHVRFF